MSCCLLCRLLLRECTRPHRFAASLLKGRYCEDLVELCLQTADLVGELPQGVKRRPRGFELDLQAVNATLQLPQAGEAVARVGEQLLEEDARVSMCERARSS